MGVQISDLVNSTADKSNVVIDVRKVAVSVFLVMGRDSHIVARSIHFLCDASNIANLSGIEDCRPIDIQLSEKVRCSVETGRIETETRLILARFCTGITMFEGSRRTSIGRLVISRS